MSKSASFRALLTSPDLHIVMGAYDALSARLAERDGFRALWVSGLGMSASAGLRDCSEASMTQVLAMLEYMADATSVPILVDGDSGYGNFNNVRQLTRKLGRLGLAALCLEDSEFPKKNSFAAGLHDVVSTEEFCGKIKAAKDSQLDPDFCVIARTETLISGRTMSECFDRASAYLEAGADGILVHSTKPSADQVLTFSHLWTRRSPLILVPTSYFRTPISEFVAAGVSMIIWANQTLRAAVAAVERLCVQVATTATVVDAESSLTSINDLFELLDYDELRDAEQMYASAELKQER